MHSIGLVLHPLRNCGDAVGAVMDWATARGGKVFGVTGEIARVQGAIAVSAAELSQHCDLIVSLGGDGTMLRAMRLADGHRVPVLGVNLGRLGFLAEVDIPELPAALAVTGELADVTFVLDHGAKPPVASGALEPWASHGSACWWIPRLSSAMPRMPSWSRRRPARPRIASRQAVRS